jgi:hypothetical protein
MDFAPVANMPTKSLQERVSTEQERFWNCQAHSFRRLQVYSQLEFCGLLYGKIVRLLTLLNPVHKLGRLPKQSRTIGAI